MDTRAPSILDLLNDRSLRYSYNEDKLDTRSTKGFDTDDEIEAFAKSLSKNTDVTTFIITGKNISDVSDKYLGNALSENSTLKNLHFEHETTITPIGIMMLIGGLKNNKTLRRLDFTYSYSDLGDIGIKYIAEALKVNTGLWELKLNRATNMTDTRMMYLADAIRLNNTLLKLHWDKYNNSKKGTTYFADALKQNTALIKFGNFENNYPAPHLIHELEKNIALSWLSLFEPSHPYKKKGGYRIWNDTVSQLYANLDTWCRDGKLSGKQCDIIRGMRRESAIAAEPSLGTEAERAKFLDLVKTIKQKTRQDVKSGSIKPDHALVIESHVCFLEAQMRKNMINMQDINMVKENIAPVLKTLNWRVIVSALLGAAMGLVIGAVMGVFTGPAIGMTALAGGIAGAALVGGIGGFSGAGLGLWRTPQYPNTAGGTLAETTDFVERIVNQNKP